MELGASDLCERAGSGRGKRNRLCIRGDGIGFRAHGHKVRGGTVEFFEWTEGGEGGVALT